MSKSLSPPAAIAPGMLYPLAVFKQLTGFQAHAMRTARRNGLKVRYIGGRAFVHADDFFSYLEKLDREQTSDRSK